MLPYVVLFYTTERIIFLLVVYGNSSQGLQTFASGCSTPPRCPFANGCNIIIFLIFLLLCSTTSTHRRSRGVGARDCSYELFEENVAALLDISSANPSRRGERYYYVYGREIGVFSI
jgi:hypothetical protein